MEMMNEVFFLKRRKLMWVGWAGGDNDGKTRPVVPAKKNVFDSAEKPSFMLRRAQHERKFVYIIS